MKPIATLIILLSILFSPSAEAQYIFTATDVDGTTHDIQAYLDEGKPVFIVDFPDNWGYYWGLHEDGAHVELYNTLGQGGTGEIVVLYIAGAGFDSESEIYDVDYSADLGVGYESVDLTAGHSIPVIVAAENPEVFGSEKGGRLWVCPYADYAYVNNTFLSAEELLEALNDQCCTLLEGEDPGISWSNSTIFDANCDPTSLEYILSNNAAADLNQVAVDVYLNGGLLENIVYDETIAGCSEVTLDYNNPSIQEGDEVMMAINQANDNLSNDTVSTVRDLVDTVGTTIKIEILNPTDSQSEVYFAFSPGFEAYAASWNNYFNYAFLEPGCYSFYLSAGDFDFFPEMVIAGSIDENDNYTDTIYYGPMGDIQEEPFTLFIAGDSAVQKVWGYVFEDADEVGGFSPDFPRIAGIQVNYGSFTTFTDADGYYEFEGIIPGENISITYDENVWPVYTTPGVGQVSVLGYIHNFGLNSDDPFYDLTGSFDFGLPYFCENGIGHNFVVFNTGNQAASGLLTFTHDAILTPTFFDPSPTQINGNELTYELNDIPYGGAVNLTVIYSNLQADLLGSLITAGYALSTLDDQGSLVSSVSESISDTLFCAYDPNDKYGFPLGSGEEGIIEADTPLKYRIRFQNTGNFPATTVVIRDTLPAELDWESFVPISATHEYSIVMNSETREVVWTFNDIQLPDSASDPLGSQGALWFDIEMNDLEIGDQIENTAFIFFDANEAIVTNTSLHTIGEPLSIAPEQPRTFSIYPNPADGMIFFKGDFSEGSVVRLTDLSGRLVMQRQLNRNALDISSLETGVYLISIDNMDAVKLMVGQPRD